MLPPRLLLAAALLASSGAGLPGPPAAGGEPPPPASPRPGGLLAERPRYSQGNVEVVVRDFFRDRRGGVFVDVGCAAPITDSNTYYLERHLGWSGIAVDAQPEYAASWARKRPRSRFFSFFVSDRDDAEQAFYRSPDMPGISTGVQERARRGPGGRKVEFAETRVPTITLDRLLERAGVARFDFLSMDIEGAEPLALAGFDVERFRPALACVEAKPENRERILAYFRGHGYRRLDEYLRHDEVNHYFAPASPGPR